MTPLKGPYRAEDYYQDYALHTADNSYIQAASLTDNPSILWQLGQPSPVIITRSTESYLAYPRERAETLGRQQTSGV